MPRTLIAGFGNVLRGDDGFGVEVVRRLGQRADLQDVTLMEVGAGGVHLAQELLSIYDQLIVVDAMERGSTAGSVYVLEVDDVAIPDRVDMHDIVPSSALALAKRLGVLPRRVFLVCCEPGSTDELSLELTPPVEAAVDRSIDRIIGILSAPDTVMRLSRI